MSEDSSAIMVCIMMQKSAPAIDQGSNFFPTPATALANVVVATLVGGLDMGLLRELQHLGEVFSEEFTELIDAHLLWLDAELGELLAQRRVVERFLRDVVQLVHDAARSLSGR
jgi:hypothetical protein